MIILGMFVGFTTRMRTEVYREYGRDAFLSSACLPFLSKH